MDNTVKTPSFLIQMGTFMDKSDKVFLFCKMVQMINAHIHRFENMHIQNLYSVMHVREFTKIHVGSSKRQKNLMQFSQDKVNY